MKKFWSNLNICSHLFYDLTLYQQCISFIYKSSVLFGIFLKSRPSPSSVSKSWDSKARIASICLKTVEKAYGMTVSIIIKVIRRIMAVGKIIWTSWKQSNLAGGKKENPTCLPGDLSAFTTEWNLAGNTQPISSVQVRRTLKVIFFSENKLCVPVLLGSYIDCQTSEIVREKPGAFCIKSKSKLNPITLPITLLCCRSIERTGQGKLLKVF